MERLKMAIDKVVIISVVRDFEMYAKCVSGNSHNANAVLQSYDNKDMRESVPVVYNRFLESYDYSYPAWFVFCHEDFEFLESVAEKLNSVDRQSIYGPIGGRLCPKWQWLLGGLWPGELKGAIIESAKDGSGLKFVGDGSPTGTIIDTVDCQCVIVHSDLVRDGRLRFDEALSFDLYAEDFCLNAAVRMNVVTRVLNLKCHHHSQGTLLPRFFDQKEHLDAKYPNSEAMGAVGYTIGCGRTPFRRLQKKLRKIMDKRCPCLVKLIFKLLP